ncbi:hypothetical protein ACLOAV_007565 [Pseudogymnoascus australis]
MFDKLPPEIVARIAWSINTIRDFSALCRTCRQAYVLLDGLLYRYDVQHSSSSALRWAAKHDDEIVYRKAREAGAVIHFVDEVDWSKIDCDFGRGTDYTWSQALLRAAENGRQAMVDLLLATEGIHVYGHDGKPLLVAACYGHHRIVERLLQTGRFNPNSKSGPWNLTPLHCAAREGHVTVIETLLRHNGVDVNARGGFDDWTPLMCAANSGREPSVRVLLAADGVNMDTQDLKGRTALAWACDIVCNNSFFRRPAVVSVADKETLSGPNQQAKRLVVVKALCDVGASIFISDAQGETPLHRAVASSFTDIVSYLAAKPGACEATNDAGCTPLSCAASHGKADVVEVLLRYSATDAPVDGCGRTPMFVAIDKGHGSVVDILLSFNPARIRDTDCNGMTLFERAGRAKNKDILRLLRRHARSQGLPMSMLTH